MFKTNIIRYVMLLATICFFGFELHAQTSSAIAPNKYCGTWGGIAIDSNSTNKNGTPIILRIHNVDNQKQLIEVTAIGNHFDTGEEILEPFKEHCKGGTTPIGIYFELRKKDGGTVKLNFKNSQQSGYDLLQTYKKDSEPAERFRIHLVKITDDISPFIKPKDSIQIHIKKTLNLVSPAGM